MDFEPSGEQQLLKDSVSRFVEREYTFEARRALARAGGFGEANWRTFADMGWLAVGLPEDVGGLGSGIVEQGIIAEGLGAALVLEPWLEVAVLAGRALERSGGAAAAALLEQMAAGEARPVLAHGEAGAFAELAWVETRAERRGDGWVIDGRKTMIGGAPFATHFLVSARTSGEPGAAEGISLFLLPADAAGVTRTDVRMADSSRASELVFDAAALGADALLGAEGGAFTAIADAHAHALVALGAMAVGAMDRVVWMTRDYLNTRVQFGKPIGTFQALQHRMADMLIEVEMSRAQVFRAMAHLPKAPAERDRAVSSLKVQIGRSAKFVGGNAIQLHGGIGVTEEYAVGHYFKRLTMIDNMFGTVGLHLDRMAALGAAA